MYACPVVHVMRICYFELCYLEFSFGYLENSLLRISLSRIFKKGRESFRFKPYEKSFEKSTTFHGKFARTKDDFRRILFALLLHNIVRSFMRLPNVSSQLCTFSCGRQKNCLLVLCSKRSFLSRSVKTI